MTYLGDSGLGVRLGTLVRGWFEGKPARQPVPDGFLVIGHRGAPDLEAENTLPSFGRALAEGANAIEADVCATRDGRFALWHDADPEDPVALLRQSGGEGYLFRPDVPEKGSPWRRPVRRLSLEELQRHYRYVCDGEDGEKVPAREASVATLPELLGWSSGQPRLCSVLLDVKLAPDQAAEAAALLDLVQDTVAGGKLPGITIRLLSPQAEIVATLLRCGERRRLPDQVRVSADFEFPGAPAMAPGTGARDVSLGCGRRLWPGFRRDVARCVEKRDEGVLEAVIAWTINDPDRLEELVATGPNGILTDDAATLRRIVETRFSQSGLHGDPRESVDSHSNLLT